MKQPVLANDEQSTEQHPRSEPTPSTQSPQEFYAELTRRPEIRDILADLARQ